MTPSSCWKVRCSKGKKYPRLSTRGTGSFKNYMRSTRRLYLIRSSRSSPKSLAKLSIKNYRPRRNSPLRSPETISSKAGDHLFIQVWRIKVGRICHERSLRHSKRKDCYFLGWYFQLERVHSKRGNSAEGRRRGIRGYQGKERGSLEQISTDESGSWTNDRHQICFESFFLEWRPFRWENGSQRAKSLKNTTTYAACDR
jgi:hypothetical protein